MPTTSPAAVMEHLAAVLNSDDVEGGLSDILSPQLVYNGERLCAQTVISRLAPFRAAVPDLQCTLEVVTTGASWASSLWRVSGTHSADYLHPVLGRTPATLRRIEFTYSLHCRVEDARIAEVRDVSDRLELFQQMHILPVLGLGKEQRTLVTSVGCIAVPAAETNTAAHLTDGRRAR